jgi:hypothetical protein
LAPVTFHQIGNLPRYLLIEWRNLAGYEHLELLLIDAGLEFEGMQT